MTVAQDLVLKGWQPVWCTSKQSNTGFTPLTGCTGEAPYPTVLAQPQQPHRLAFRVPAHLVIIDVDHYGTKQGAHTLDRAEEWLGDLPATYKVTSRGFDDPSGRLIFRKPIDLDFQNSALNQFANDNGKTDIDILRIGHRYSWAPGDINHKNGLTVQCFDPDGEPCWLPSVDDESIPELPQRWVDYLRNPPRGNNFSAYTRPADGPRWWLQQADDSLGSDDELKDFTWDMMMSRVDIEDIYLQWLRVARNDDPAWLWDRVDFDRHASARAQQKAVEGIEREEAVLDSLPASREQLAHKEQAALEDQERSDKLVALRDQRISEAIAQQNLFPAVPIEVDEPQPATQSFTEYVKTMVRGYPEFGQEMRKTMVRDLAKADVAELLTTPFTGYKKIGQLAEPSPPETLIVTGKGTESSAIVPRAKVTVISGHRSSGKTWVVAAWAAQEITAGNTIFWIDFERQDAELSSKLRMLGVPEHLIDNQVKYTDALPPAEALIHDVQQASEGGLHRVLVVIDAWRALQSRVMPGTTAIDGDAVEQVYTDYLTPVCEAGANVAIIDHMAKGAGSTAPATTFGSERKESAADYVLLVDQTARFSKKTSGFSTITLTKGRRGDIDAGTAVGYLWMPGDSEETADRGITKYPKRPELRNWAPENAEIGLDAVSGQSEKSQREEAVLSVVRDNRLQLGARDLGRHVHEVYSDLFASPKAATDFAARMKKDGKLAKEEGRDGKYDIPDITAPVEVNSPASPIDPGMLRHDEEL